MEDPIKSEIKRDEEGKILKGSGPLNPAGRPKGKTLKEFAREYLMTLQDDEKLKYLDSLPKEIVWKMAEGMPKQDTDITSNGNTVFTTAEREEADKAIDKLLNGTN